jgi:hypothetical protein
LAKELTGSTVDLGCCTCWLEEDASEELMSDIPELEDPLETLEPFLSTTGTSLSLTPEAQAVKKSANVKDRNVLFTNVLR